LAAKKYSGFAEAYEGTPEAELAKEQLPSVLFSWAETLSLGGQDEQAIAKYLEIQQKYKDSEWAERARRAVPSVALQHARRLERNQDYEGASEAYRNLAENYQETEAGQTAAKKLPEAMLAAAKKCLERNETEKGVKLLEDVAAKYSMAPAGEAASKLLPEILLQRAEAFTAGGKAAEADAALREIIEKFSSSDAAAKARDRRAELLYAGSQELIKAGKTKEGIAKFDELARAFPESPLVAQHQSEMNGLRAQLASAEPGGAAAKPAPELLYQTAMNLMAQGQKDEALTKLETLVRDFPNAPVAAKARETLAKTLYEEAEQLKAQGRPKESAELMEELTKQFPESEWAQKAKDEKARLAGIPEGMILMAGGPFNMGSEETEIRAFVAGEEEADAQTMKGAMMCETPKHEVNAPAFYIDRTEVTNAQYLKFVEETGRTPPAHWVRGKPLPGKEDHPVVYVNWEDAEAYAKWAGKRLPTEAEWEFAARGTDGRAYPWGRKFDSSKCNFMNPKVKATMPVGSFPDGASPSGCLDMVGNAAEWTAGGFEQYPGNRAPQPEYGQKLRVVRGGAWNDTLAVYGRCASRRPMEPGLKERGLGFRCAKDAK
jgi:formylglycine-generating enzyme required for sulfatase activity